MFCENCGKPLDEDAKFCISCGQPIGAEANSEISAQEPAAEEIEAVEAVVETPVEENDFVNPDFNEKKKLSKGVKKIIIASTAVVVAVAVALGVIFNLDYFKGLFVKTFSSDAEYYSYVEQKNFAESKDSIVRLYNSYRTAFTSEDPVSTKASISLSVGEDFKKLLSADSLKAFSDISIDLTSNQQEKLSQVIMELSFSNTKILDMDFISDISKGKMYLGMPSLSDTYAVDEVQMDEEMQTLYDPQLWKALPTDKVVGDILEKYVGVALNSIDNVTSSTKTVTVDGISQKCTVLKYTLTEKNVLGIEEKTLKSLKADDEIKIIIKGIEKYGVENGLCDEDYDMYGEFSDAINEAITDIADYKNDADNKNGIVVLTYVNSKHEIIGRELSVADEDESEKIMYFVTAKDGEDFATTLEIADVITVLGKGRENADVINGKYTLAVDDEKIVSVKLANYDTSKARDGIVSGKIKISPEKALWENLDLDSMYTSLLAMYDPALELVIDANESASDFELNLLGKDKVMFGIKYNYQKADGSDIKVPTKTIDATDTTDPQEWIETFDFEKLKKNLEKAGLPAEMADAFEAIFSGDLYGDSYDNEADYIEDVYGDEYDFDYEYDF